MSARSSPIPQTGIKDRNTVAVNYRSPLRELLRQAGVDTYGGDVHSEDLFPSHPERGVVTHRVELFAFSGDQSVRDAIEEIRKARPNHEPADLWTLAHCTHLIADQAEGKKLYSFVPQLAKPGQEFVQYPLIGRNKLRMFIGLTRDVFHVEPGCAALLVEKVLVRG